MAPGVHLSKPNKQVSFDLLVFPITAYTILTNWRPTSRRWRSEMGRAGAERSAWVSGNCILGWQERILWIGAMRGA